MRTRSLLISSFLILVIGACRSTDSGSSTEPEDGMSEPMDETEGGEAPSDEAGAEPSGQGGGIDAEASRQQRVQEQREYLASTYIQRGNELLDRADLEGALGQYSQALEVMPSNEEARERMRQVRALMGDSYAEAADAFDDAVQREEVRRAQARIEADQWVTAGDNALRDGDFDRAIESYRRALTVLRFNPLIASDSLDERVVDEKLSTAMQMAAEADAQRALDAQETARREREALEAEQLQYRENKLRTLYAQANEAFRREQYGTAEALAEQILLYDPGNETATELRDIAQSARHQKTNEENRRRYRENWIRTFEQLDTLAIPQTDVMEYELDRWREVSTRRPYEFRTNDPLSTQDKEAILQRLSELRVQARFGVDGEGAPIEEVANYLQSVTNVNFLVSAQVKDLDEEETAINLNLPERSVLKLLNIITELHSELHWKIEDGIVKFVTAEELTGGQVLRMYEVRDLIRPISDFPGREINISPSGGPPEFEEDIEEREALVVTADTLDQLIRDNVAPESWEADPANSLRISAGTLVVNQTPEVHEHIQKLLDDLREATGIMVDIQSRFLKVEDNFLEDIGVEFRGLGSPGLGTNAFFDDFGDATAQQTLGQQLGSGDDLGAFFDDGGDGNVRARTENLYDNFLGEEDVLTGSGGLSFQWTYLNDLELEMILRAVAKSERVELVTAPRVLVFNTARSNLTVMNQLAYVQDFDVEIAQAASIADPVIGVVQDGVILDVRPVVSADRRFITLELRPTVAELRRPIRTFTTSLGVSGNSVTIQLPELEISRVRTSVPMPDGGTVLLGGFKVHSSQDLRSGVPILNKIPVLSFFFERKGTFVSNRKLLILLKANIVIPDEREPTSAQLGLDPVAAPR